MGKSKYVYQPNGKPSVLMRASLQMTMAIEDAAKSASDLITLSQNAMLAKI
jgi:hypothetical protein